MYTGFIRRGAEMFIKFYNFFIRRLLKLIEKNDSGEHIITYCFQ